MSALRFSLVIPAYNEAQYLPRLIDTVDVARSRYKGGADAIEVIVSDNDSTDGTGEIARERGYRTVFVEKRCIASVRNGGAGLAQGEILCFVDADMRIHPETFNVIDEVLQTDKYVVGSTGIRVERMSLGIGVTLAVMVPLLWLTKIDTGVVFCRRSDFEKIGGYNEELLVGEDMNFLKDMAKLGRKKGQGLVRATQAKALSSARKWDEHGEWHFFKVAYQFFYCQFFAREKFDRFSQRFWYGDQREKNDDE